MSIEQECTRPCPECPMASLLARQRAELMAEIALGEEVTGSRIVAEATDAAYFAATPTDELLLPTGLFRDDFQRRDFGEAFARINEEVVAKKVEDAKAELQDLNKTENTIATTCGNTGPRGQWHIGPIIFGPEVCGGTVPKKDSLTNLTELL